MLSKEEYLLVKLSEECAEVIKECSKALEFGLQDYPPTDPSKNNAERIVQEFEECKGIMWMLTNEDILQEPTNPKQIQIDRVNKTHKYMDYARNLGKLELEDE